MQSQLSGDDKYLMDETKRKPTTGRQSHSLLDKWHGIFYMPSRIDTAGHTNWPLITQSWGTGGKPKCSVPRVGLEPTTHRFTDCYTEEYDASVNIGAYTGNKDSGGCLCLCVSDPEILQGGRVRVLEQAGPKDF